MSRFRAVFPEDRTDINLSPMLDVVFILLIFFVVVATFVREDAIPITLQQDKPDPIDRVETIFVKIESEGVFVVNGRVMSRGSVAPYVQALHGESPEASFAVTAGNNVPIQDTVVAIDAGHAIGLDVITILPIGE
jgi:biopolymer transport protein ExbD